VVALPGAARSTSVASISRLVSGTTASTSTTLAKTLRRGRCKCWARFLLRPAPSRNTFSSSSVLCTGAALPPSVA
ncbi:hypothetical protein LTR17_023508, partial [Elasticomyces elasticus]